VYLRFHLVFDPMIVPITNPFRRRKGRPRPVAVAAPPAPLMLIGANFSPVTTILRLTFNKPVNVDDIFPGNLQVNDGVSPGGIQWEGQGPVTQPTPSVVEVGMFEIQAQAYPDTRLNAAEPTGIVAVEGAEAWAGVADLLLPFP
jgi:hypothetical protein